ncbi:MAG: molybdopterin converting factor subunit 1 [Hyphomicrobium sp.]|uniref:molybdopterin converting factor subunit 1 n=1 Tax=Hyphomicrobium sp. TaxID=82 RepID=UPI003D135029
MLSGIASDVAASATAGQRLTVRYFAWVREKVGRSEETLEVPAEVATAGDLVRWLAARGPEFAEAFARPEVVRVALDQVHAKPTASLRGVREVALFPPVTGG